MSAARTTALTADRRMAVSVLLYFIILTAIAALFHRLLIKYGGPGCCLFCFLSSSSCFLWRGTVLFYRLSARKQDSLLNRQKRGAESALPLLSLLWEGASFLRPDGLPVGARGNAGMLTKLPAEKAGISIAQLQGNLPYPAAGGAQQHLRLIHPRANYIQGERAAGHLAEKPPEIIGSIAKAGRQRGKTPVGSRIFLYFIAEGRKLPAQRVRLQALPVLQCNLIQRHLQPVPSHLLFAGAGGIEHLIEKLLHKREIKQLPVQSRHLSLREMKGKAIPKKIKMDMQHRQPVGKLLPAGIAAMRPQQKAAARRDRKREAVGG